MPKKETAIRFNTEKSQSWIIGTETLLVGGAVGFLCYNAEMHPAVSIGAGIATMLILFTLLLHVSWIFWLWTFVLSAAAAIAAGLITHGVSDQDMGWAAAAALVAGLIVISVHVTSRRHARAEATPNKVTRLT
ncbi:MAG: hypothetical protein HRU13_06470 [Phycisphaerales bacterium]|nr:hypothetical protein [Phycisphaerales bacterium]